MVTVAQSATNCRTTHTHGWHAFTHTIDVDIVTTIRDVTVSLPFLQPHILSASLGSNAFVIFFEIGLDN